MVELCNDFNRKCAHTSLGSSYEDFNGFQLPQKTLEMNLAMDGVDSNIRLILILPTATGLFAVKIIKIKNMSGSLWFARSYVDKTSFQVESLA